MSDFIVDVDRLCALPLLGGAMNNPWPIAIGLLIDVLGFLVIAQEWRMSHHFRLGEELKKTRYKNLEQTALNIQQSAIQELNPEIANQLGFGATDYDHELGKLTSKEWQELWDSVLPLNAFSLSSRSFHIGILMIVLGFILQAIGTIPCS